MKSSSLCRCWGSISYLMCNAKSPAILGVLLGLVDHDVPIRLGDLMRSRLVDGERKRRDFFAGRTRHKLPSIF